MVILLSWLTSVRAGLRFKGVVVRFKDCQALSRHLKAGGEVTEDDMDAVRDAIWEARAEGRWDAGREDDAREYQRVFDTMVHWYNGGGW